jgi:hypothetical protein
VCVCVCVFVCVKGAIAAAVGSLRWQGAALALLEISKANGMPFVARQPRDFPHVIKHGGAGTGGGGGGGGWQTMLVLKHRQ